MQQPELLSVVLMVIMFYINKDMYSSDRKRKKIVFFDEAWRFLQATGTQNALATFIEELYRQVRKYNGAVISATQSIADYFKSDAARAAYSCSSWRFILKQTQEAVLSMQTSDQYVMDDYEKRMILSLRTESGVYSEIFIKSALGRGIGRLFLDPQTVLLYSSKPADYEATKAYTDQGMDISEAIDQVLRDRGVLT